MLRVGGEWKCGELPIFHFMHAITARNEGFSRKGTQLMKINMNATARTALTGVALLGLALSLTACGTKDGGGGAAPNNLFPTAHPVGQDMEGGAPTAGAPSSVEMADPVALGRAWVDAVQQERYSDACTLMSAYAVSDMVSGRSMNLTCGEALKDGLSGLGDSFGENYDRLFSAAGAVTMVTADKTCADPGLPLGGFCFLRLGWSEDYFITKSLVKTSGGFQVGVLNNDTTDSYANTHAAGGAQVGDL